ncbi:uncharacterized protein N7477_002461 [Penicillium maclennaniae]|uniref:uncharacterized protein n=1 Tax=Penicillium maclennaniae TaxID=1343394 RepID=UPI0025421C05|nr:uncharacterized protein N7477_002461 [Penicillium maclennaniae]KAJ5676828.1 hypothetical protein N7477_002461 [Penicillium maclennaniae]
MFLAASGSTAPRQQENGCMTEGFASAYSKKAKGQVSPRAAKQVKRADVKPLLKFEEKGSGGSNEVSNLICLPDAEM